MAIMTATITIDTFKSETLPIAQAGIPQGSPLSPILYNVNLVEQPINKTRGTRICGRLLGLGCRGEPR
jgi:hypothetical protein